MCWVNHPHSGHCSAFSHQTTFQACDLLRRSPALISPHRRGFLHRPRDLIVGYPKIGERLVQRVENTALDSSSEQTNRLYVLLQKCCTKYLRASLRRLGLHVSVRPHRNSKRHVLRESSFFRSFLSSAAAFDFSQYFLRLSPIPSFPSTTGLCSALSAVASCDQVANIVNNSLSTVASRQVGQKE